MTTKLEQRLEQMKAYRDEALKDPENNRLYLEDLAVSIAMFEQAAGNQNNVHGGFNMNDFE